MSKEEFVETLDLPFDGEMWNDDYVITVDTSDDFSYLYNLISNNNELTLDDRSITTTDNALFTFFNDEYEVRLTADFNKDIYRLMVSDR